MRLCTECLHVDDRSLTHCPSCGGSSLARARSSGDVVAIPAAAGMPCQNCYEVDRDLGFRLYRRVVGMLIADSVYIDAGYFCAACRRGLFIRHMVLTLLLGWWGILAFWFRNPFAIAANVWSLFASPPGSSMYGALTIQAIRAQAAADEEREQRLADIYMAMPAWMESLTEEDLQLIAVDTDYYAILGAEKDATHQEIKSAYRQQAKRHHPDTAGAGAHDRMIELSAAYKVLGDERLRHAYDHRDELHDALSDLANAMSDTTEPAFEAKFGCTDCRLGFATFDDAAEHVDLVHPHVDYRDIIVELVDEPVEADEPSAPGAPGKWRCKACLETFDDYDDALEHADGAHPERTVVDVRAAVEAV